MARKGVTKSGGQKNKLDKFYTKPDTAKKCLTLLNLHTYTTIIEPSAGNGAFSNLLFALKEQNKIGGNIYAFDIRPEENRIVEQDWFDYTPQLGEEKILVVGNPPFGQQCSLAIKFINHAFILPRSFTKESLQNRITHLARLTQEIPLQKNSFTLADKDYDVPSVFQMWERVPENTCPRPSLAPLTSEWFSFVKQTEPYDFAIRRVGGKAGHSFIPDGKISDQTNYFIKKNRITTTTQETIRIFNSLDYAVAGGGTGPKSLSKRELVRIVSEHYKNKNLNHPVVT